MQNKGRDPNQHSDEWGGAFFVRGTAPAESTLTLNDCTLRNNVALSDSGVIDSIEASVIAIDDSAFTDNRSGRDGGVGCVDGISLDLSTANLSKTTPRMMVVPSIRLVSCHTRTVNLRTTSLKTRVV